MTDERRGRRVTKPKGTNWRVIPVRVIETGEVYPTMRDAAEAIGGTPSTVLNRLRQDSKTPYRGYTFEYVRPDWWPFDTEENDD